MRVDRRGLDWQRLAPYILGAMILLCAAGFSTYSILRHMDRQSTTLDLGIQTQVVWNTAQGRPFESSIEVRNYLGDHLSLILAFLAPLYWVWPDVRLLLAFQAVALALGAYPVYRLAREELGDERVGLLFALVYLLYPAVGFIVRFDFHAEALVTPLLLAGLWCWRSRKTGPALLWFLLALLCREETGLVLAALGLVLALRSRGPERRLAWRMGAIGLVWTVLGMGLVMPHLRGQPSDTFLQCFPHLGQSYGEGLLRLVRDPFGALRDSWQGLAGYKATLLPRLLLPLAFLPLLAPGLLLPLLPGLLPAVFSRCLPHSTIYYQYTAPMIPFLFWAGIVGFRRAEGVLARLRRGKAADCSAEPLCGGASPPAPPAGGLHPMCVKLSGFPAARCPARPGRFLPGGSAPQALALAVPVILFVGGPAPRHPPPGGCTPRAPAQDHFVVRGCVPCGTSPAHRAAEAAQRCSRGRPGAGPPAARSRNPAEGRRKTRPAAPGRNPAAGGAGRLDLTHMSHRPLSGGPGSRAPREEPAPPLQRDARAERGQGKPAGEPGATPPAAAAGQPPRANGLLRAGLLLLVLLGTAGALVWDFPWWKPVEGPGLYTVGRPEPRANDAAFREVAALIPPDASLATDNTLGPQFAHRRYFYLFPSGESWRADYILVDLQSEPPVHDASNPRVAALLRLVSCPLPVTIQEGGSDALQWCQGEPGGFVWMGYGVRCWHDGMLLLQRGWPVDPVLHWEVRRALKW